MYSGKSRTLLLCLIVCVAEGLYTVRGQSNVSASSEKLTPTPLTARRVCVPPLGAGGGHTRWVERGWGAIALVWKTPNAAHVDM
jgi:hypothetical protein